MKMKTLLLLGGAAFLLFRDKTPKTAPGGASNEPPVKPDAHQASVGTRPENKTPRFLKGDNLRRFKELKASFGKWQRADVEKMQILENNLTTQEFEEVLLQFPGFTRVNWEALAFVTLGNK